MNNETSSLELSCLIKEFQVLIGGKIDKIYQQKSNKREFLFRMHVPSHGKKQLRVIAPGFIYLSEYKQEFTDSPPGYCTFLRKHLGNARIEAVRQVNFERIVEIIFDAKEGKLILIIELFSKGNIILCKEDYTIISPLENQRWKDRTASDGHTEG